MISSRKPRSWCRHLTHTHTHTQTWTSLFLTSVLCSQEPVSPEPGAAVRCLHSAEAHLSSDGVHGAGLPAQLSASAPRKAGITGPAGNLPRRQPGHAASGAERLHPQRPGQNTHAHDSLKIDSFHYWMNQCFWINLLNEWFNDSLKIDSFHYWMNQCFWINLLNEWFNDSLEIDSFHYWMNQCFWINLLNEWFNDSLKIDSFHYWMNQCFLINLLNEWFNDSLKIDSFHYWMNQCFFNQSLEWMIQWLS